MHHADKKQTILYARMKMYGNACSYTDHTCSSSLHTWKPSTVLTSMPCMLLGCSMSGWTFLAFDPVDPENSKDGINDLASKSTSVPYLNKYTYKWLHLIRSFHWFKQPNLFPSTFNIWSSTSSAPIAAASAITSVSSQWVKQLLQESNLTLQGSSRCASQIHP